MNASPLHGVRYLYASVIAIALLGVVLAGCERPETGPRQPIAFSHATHAGEYQIACQYCHSGVRRGPAADIPSVQTCMGCHQLVVATRPEVVKVRETWERGEPIRWMKVNELADFVHFDHYPHIAKGIDCKTCHGDVAKMEEVKPFVKVNNMTWCVDCHRENKASIDCYTCHK